MFSLLNLVNVEEEWMRFLKFTDCDAFLEFELGLKISYKSLCR